MTIPTCKTDLLLAIDQTFDHLMQVLHRVPAARTNEATLPGHRTGTLMSPADLVSYLIGWNELVLHWLERDDRNEPVIFPEAGFQWNQLGQLAQKFYGDYPNLDWAQRLEYLAATRRRLVETIEARSDDELYGKPWYGKWTKGRMIQLNSASPYGNARARLRKWLKATPNA